VRNVEVLLDGLRGIVPQLEVLSYDASRDFRAQLTGDELDHADQLLEIQGQHQEAILRAAGVVAGVVLERHPGYLVDLVNSTLAPADQYPRSDRGSIFSYAEWLMGRGVIDRCDRVPLQEVNFIRNCCDHAPGAKLRSPRRDEVQRLILDARRYVAEISFP
jgi:hypothetical protein